MLCLLCNVRIVNSSQAGVNRQEERLFEASAERANSANNEESFPIEKYSLTVKL